MYRLSIVFIFCLFQLALNGQQVYKIATYNVENLFDLQNDPNHNDDDFLPTGRQQWTQERYDKKLAQIAKVIDSMGLPDFIGLQEVENKKVLDDLCEKTSLKKAGYAPIIIESNDYRGIDVALLYKTAVFKPTNTDTIQISFPERIVKQPYTTRNILYVEGLINNSEKLHFFVNHWPSRSGGLEKSEPKRLYVAAQLRKRMNDLLNQDPNANMIIMGDFNDEPDNNSIRTILGVLENANPPIPGFLYDCFGALNQQNKGSYNYRGNWNMLDHIIVSAALYDREDGVYIQNPTIFRKDWMMYQDRKFGAKPNRTYGGPNYYGGFSDHLPVYLELVINK
ncbi:MAG: endonuclease/exonuclease/phosphatase family protein [Saprospiraceae bacterium]|nr:endonuclease/exonuclease/phosphatase family protein [Saprospiraceae bacterium]